MSTSPADLLNVAPDATPAQIEAAYQLRLRQYDLPRDTPPDLLAVAAEQRRALTAARDALLAAAAPKSSRREWLWLGGGVLVALLIIGIVAVLTRGNTAQPDAGLVAMDRQAPDLTATTLDGQTLRLSELQGNVVLVNFWATWCEPCKTETPDIVQAYADLKDQGFEVVGVNLTDQEKNLDDVRRFAQRYGVNYPVTLDENGSWQQAFGVYWIPHSYFIDSKGRIRYTRINIVSRSDIERVLQELQ